VPKKKEKKDKKIRGRSVQTKQTSVFSLEILIIQARKQLSEKN
jgi:hypothetical protein